MALGAAGIGSIFQSAGTGLQAHGVYNAGKYNEAIKKYNAVIADMRADDALTRGREDETNLRKSVRGLQGAQRASMAAQGVEIDDGSALDVQMDTAAMGEMDALTIRNNAMREAWGFRSQAEDFRAQGRLIKMESRFKAGGLLLSSIGQSFGAMPGGGS